MNEMRCVGAAIVRAYPELYKAILAVPSTDGEYKKPISRSLSIIIGNIENDCLMAARSYLESISLFVSVFVYDGFMLYDPDSSMDADAMGDWVFQETKYHVLWAKKVLYTSIDLPRHLTDSIVAGDVLKTPDGRILTCEDISFSFKSVSGLWCKNTKPTQIMQNAISSWGIDVKMSRGFNPIDYVNTVINLEQSPILAKISE